MKQFHWYLRVVLGASVIVLSAGCQMKGSGSATDEYSSAAYATRVAAEGTSASGKGRLSSEAKATLELVDQTLRAVHGTVIETCLVFPDGVDEQGAKGSKGQGQGQSKGGENKGESQGSSNGRRPPRLTDAQFEELEEKLTGPCKPLLESLNSMLNP